MSNRPGSPPSFFCRSVLKKISVAAALLAVGLGLGLVLGVGIGRSLKDFAPTLANHADPNDAIGLSADRLAISPHPEEQVPEERVPKSQLLQEQTEHDPQPLETPSWQRFAQQVPESDGRPVIAIVIDDMGVDRKRSHRAMQILGPLTLSFLPDARDLESQTATARAVGHELLLHMPMEPRGKAADPGPYALRTDVGEDENQRRLMRAFDRFSSYVGINNHMGSRFTESVSGMSLVMAELQQRGLLWLDSRTSAKTVGTAVAQQFDVPWVERDVFLDDNPAQQAIEKQLLTVEKIARRQGQAIAIGHPHDATLAVLESWRPGLERKGLVLVPLTEIVRRYRPLAVSQIAPPQIAPSEPAVTLLRNSSLHAPKTR